jgi:hypothetical protein
MTGHQATRKNTPEEIPTEITGTSTQVRRVAGKRLGFLHEHTDIIVKTERRELDLAQMRAQALQDPQRRLDTPNRIRMRRAVHHVVS